MVPVSDAWISSRTGHFNTAIGVRAFGSISTETSVEVPKKPLSPIQEARLKLSKPLTLD